MPRASLAQRMDRQYRRVTSATDPADKLLAATDAVKALAALLGDYGNPEDANGLRRDAADALMDVFMERLGRLGVHLPGVPETTEEGIGSQ